MIWATIARLAGKVPERVWIGLAVLAVALVVFQLGKCSGADQERARQAQIERKAIERTRGADDAARQTITKGQDDVRQSNERAREAASGSDDPLRSFADSVRADQTRNRPAAK
jgi:hypothetical protein